MLSAQQKEQHEMLHEYSTYCKHFNQLEKLRPIIYETGRAAILLFFFSSRRRHTRCYHDWSSDVCSSDLSVNAGSGTRSGMTNTESWPAQSETLKIARQVAERTRCPIADVSFEAGGMVSHAPLPCQRRQKPVLESAARLYSGERLPNRPLLSSFGTAVK